MPPAPAALAESVPVLADPVPAAAAAAAAAVADDDDVEGAAAKR